MNLSMKQKPIHKHRNKLVVAKRETGRGSDGLGVWDSQRWTIIYRMDQEQGPTVKHRELSPVSYDSHSGKVQEKEHIY